MKKFDIYLQIEIWGEAEEVLAQFKKAKKTFMKEIAALIEEGKIVVSKEQETLNAVSLSIKKDCAEEVINLFRKMETVNTIDAEYTGPHEEDE